jgi:hypothetical protein
MAVWVLLHSLSVTNVSLLKPITYRTRRKKQNSKNTVNSEKKEKNKFN